MGNRILALLVSITIVFSITSCGIYNSDHGKKVISPDSPWYNSEFIDVDLGVNTDRQIEDLWQQYAGSDNKNIVIFTDGYYKSDNSNAEQDLKSCTISILAVIDRETKATVKTIDLVKELPNVICVDSVTYANGILVIRTQAPDENRLIRRDYIIKLEPWNIIKTYESELDYNHYDFTEKNTFPVGGYLIEPICDSRGDKLFYTLRIISPDGEVREIDLKESGHDIFGVPAVIQLDDSTALITAAMERNYNYYKLDLKTLTITSANPREYDWIDVDELSSSLCKPDGTAYFTTPQGVSKIDLKNKKTVEVFNYGCCNVNSSYLERLEIIDCTGDSFLLGGRYYASDMFSSKIISDYVVIEFTKASKNPHAGKKVLELFMPGREVNEIVSDAVLKYNETSTGYYIKYSSKYNVDSYISAQNVNSADDYDTVMINANAGLSNDLALDIMNGEGPDILLNTNRFGQLNSSKYLVDLSPYFGTLDQDKYFTNIIDGAKTDNGLFQLPVCFTIEGIQTDAGYAGKSGVGFTTEEYESFLYGALNGKDVVESGQALYFTKLFNALSDKFIKDGKVDLSDPDFRVIAEYVKNNVQPASLQWDTVESGSGSSAGNNTAYYCNCPGISGYLVKRSQIKNGTAILGLPSADGRGPMFGTNISVAVSATAVDIDACVEFVKLLMSDEIQTGLVMNDNFVLNREAFRKGCDSAIKYYNETLGDPTLFDYSTGTYVSVRKPFSDEDIDNLEKIILSCSRVDSPDSVIEMILIEEMPAYFTGQKDLAAVASIVQDRAQKVLNER